MVQVPSNLIPTRVTELPEPPSYDGQGLLLYTYNGTSYKISAQQLVAGAQGVTSVNASGGTTGLTFSGGPVTSVGVLTLAGVLNVTNGGTGAADPAGARVNLDSAQRGDNADITSLSGVTGGISTPDFVQLDVAAAASVALGKLRWNADTNTVAFGIIDGTQEVNVGQQLYAYVYNAESVSITRGQAVYLYQATGNRASVKLANNTGDPTSAKTLGLVAQTIAAGQNGFVIAQGVLDKIDTSAFAEGDTLYLGSTAGALTATKPVAPNHLVYIGVVERANAGNGQIYVRPQNGYELDELHDVRITSKADGDLLQYYSAGPYWRNIAPSSVSVGTATNLAAGAAGSLPYQTASGTTSMLAVGVSGRYLSSSGSAPQWSAPAALTKTDDTNVTLTLGGSASTALLNAASVTAGWTGQLATGRGGTGLGTYTAGDLLYYASGTALTRLGIGASSRLLTSSGTAPQWSDPATVAVGTATNLNGGAANRLAYQTAANTTGFVAAPTVASTYLSWNGTGFAWAAIGGGGTVTSVAVSSTDLTVSGSPITSSGTISLALNTVPVSKGGTGATTLTGVVKGNGTSAFTAGNVSLTTEVTGTLPIANGGTGQTSAQLALNALAGAVTSGQYLRGNGTNVVMSSIQASDVPTLNQNTTGTAANASNSAITDDTTTAATMYLAWVTAASGNLPLKVTSTKLTFNPSTGILTSTGGICGGTF